MKRLIVGAASVCAIGAAVPAIAQDQTVIGLAVAQSGFMQAYDGDATDAVRLWIEDQNAKGGLLGKQLTSVTSDTKSDRAQGARAGQDVIDQGAAIVVVSCDYDFGAPAAAAAQRAGLLSLFLCAEDPKAGVQGAGPFAFTASIAAQVQGATIAEWAQEEKGAKTYYSLLDTTLEYNKSVCAGFDWSADRIGLTSLGEDSFKNDDPTVQAQITRINGLTEKPDALVLCSHMPGAASAIRQVRAAGLDMPILSGSAIDGTYWTDAVPDLNGVFIPVQASVHGDDPRPEVNAFMERFEERYDRRPATTYAVPAYAFMELWARAVETAGTTNAADVVAVLEGYSDEQTLIGPKSFSDQYHIQLISDMQIIEYADGKPSVTVSYRMKEPLTDQILFRLK